MSLCLLTLINSVSRFLHDIKSKMKLISSNIYRLNPVILLNTIHLSSNCEALEEIGWYVDLHVNFQTYLVCNLTTH